MKETIFLLLISLTVILLVLSPTLAQIPLQSTSSKSGLRNKGLLSQSPEENELESVKIPSAKFRLNDTFTVHSYDIELLIILDNDPEIGEQFTAPGKVLITAAPTANTSRITLHANLLRINYESIKVTQVSDPSVVIKVTGFDNDTDSGRHFFSIDVDKTLVGEILYNIYIDYIAPISTDRRNGLYLSSYIDPVTGEQRRQAATQMESFYARQLFPSFDEPELKARFGVTIIHKDNYTALANSDYVYSVPDPTRPGWTIDKFSFTYPMSTYLFAIFVSHFTFVEVEVETEGGVIPIRIHGPPDMIERGGANYSLAMTAEVFKKFNEYFDTPFYPFTKMDSVAVPIKGGAMENYALILYRSDLLTYYPGETTEMERFSGTDTIAHEVAHQNFGNLVTCKWWSSLFLNEGFATYVSSLGTDWIHPEFKAREQFINTAVQTSMAFDAMDASHPLFNDAETPPEIDLIFSTITYEKGGSIIRMIENFLTEETLQKGLQYYLKEMQYQSVEQDDLYRNLQKASDEDNRLPNGVSIKDILDTWILQRGFPLVKVTVTSNNSVIISQERYRNDTKFEILKQLDPSDLWYVPLTVVTEDKPNLENTNNIPEIWLAKSEAARSYSHDTSKWIMVNKDAAGYYRVLYDAPLLSLIQRQLEANASVISALSRSQLLDDYLTFGLESKRTPVATALNLTRYLTEEDHFTVWATILRQLVKPYTLLSSSTDGYTKFRNYFLPLIESALLKVGLEQSPQHIGVIAIHREKILNWACSMEHVLCIQYGQKFFSEWQSSPNSNPIPADIRAVLQCSIVSSGGTPAFEFIFARYQAEPEGAQKTRLLNALACVGEVSTLQSLLEKTLNETSGILKSDATALIQQVSRSSTGRPIVIPFLRNRLAEIISIIGAGSPSPVASVVTTLSEYYNTEEDLLALENFINENAEFLSPIDTTLKSALENVRLNIGWTADIGRDILQWLET